MEETTHYYKPSGKFSILALLTVPVLGSLAAGIGALIYSALIWYIPFIYINFFITLGFGFLLLMAVMPALRMARVRNLGVGFLLGLLVGALGVYLEWSVYCALLISAGETTEVGSGLRALSFTDTSFDLDLMLNVALHPSVIWEIIKALYAEGSWGIFRITVSGIPLVLVWLVEAGIIAFLPALGAIGVASEPFSEKEGKWMKETKFKGRIAPDDAILNGISLLEQGRFDAIFDAARVSEDESGLGFVAYSDSRKEENYLTIQMHRIETTSDGKSKTTSADVVTNLKIAKIHLDRLAASLES